MADEHAVLSPEQRRDILDQEIAKYVGYGFRVVSHTDTTVQLVRPKEFSVIVALACFLMLGVGLFLYLLFYLAEKDATVYLQVTSSGEITGHATGYRLLSERETHRTSGLPKFRISKEVIWLLVGATVFLFGILAVVIVVIAVIVF